MNTSNINHERGFKPSTIKILEVLLGDSLDSYITSERYNDFHKRFFNGTDRSVSELETLCDEYMGCEILSSRSRYLLNLIYTKYISPWTELWSTLTKELV